MKRRKAAPSSKLEAKESYKQKVYHFDDVDHHWITSNFILNGYRICNNYKESWISLTYFHNESMNIWTHLISGFLFMGSIYNIWMNWEEPTVDKVIFSIYCVCAIKCFFMSSLFHLHMHQTYSTFLIFSCLDYAGVSIMIMGSSILMTYYVYYCNYMMQMTWITLAVCSSLVGIVGPYFESFSKNPKLRTTCYIFSAAFCALPVIIYTSTHTLPFNHSGILCFLGMTFCYLGGAAVYLHKIPERYAPGYFDYLFASHQIWHCCVFMAAVFMYWCALDTMAWREENKCLI